MDTKIVINCAMSADGKIALPDRSQIRLSNKEDMERVNKLRKESDAILVGIGTVIEDNPRLIIKNNKNLSTNPVRVVLDTNGRTPINSNVLDDKSRTIIAVGNHFAGEIPGNSEVIKCGDEQIDIELLMEKLYERGLKNILVEGGENVLWSFLNQNLFDEINIFVASLIVGGAKTPTVAGGSGFTNKIDTLQLKLKEAEKIGNGILLKYCKK
ncbi:MAG: diaminohydroxyphosphoribosylaminopyrimidine reductase [Marine Group III euryarchaeote CG-Epi1]|uniref:2,5-diamino-6-(ribosylamino)-4(3H)-pyrimidinone 5'-phosphate reductase n=1 Tax=Marine Group III euryarchaeote CG-Epi1 TaxID=1888995 RepID=A0A1J5TEB8_9ARCH|nr:MAG: diaminohydroxyphosphoribosylaminopyrimidine reductase [Marine Group III euryarchaeote CG-Epi1]